MASEAPSEVASSSSAPAPALTTAGFPAVYLPPASVPPPRVPLSKPCLPAPLGHQTDERLRAETFLADLPDSAYDLTPGEAQSVLAGIAKRAKDDSVLRTSKMRERDTQPVRRWDETKIRIKFADRTLIQQTFQSTAPLKDVYAFVRASLAPHQAEAEFTLYIPPNQNLPEVPPSPPPRSKLPSKRFTPPEPIKISLADHGLAPSSVLSIRFVDSALNGSEMRAPLREELLERAEELPVPAGTPTPSTATASPTATPVPDKPEPAKAGGGKMPKWFKGPGKK